MIAPRSLVQLRGKPPQRLLPPPGAISRCVKQISLGKHSPGQPCCFDSCSPGKLGSQNKLSSVISSSPGCGRLGARIRDGTGFELQTKPTKAFLLRFTMPWAVFSGRSYAKRELTFTECLLCFSLCAGGFIYIISFNPHKQPCGFNAAKPDT